MSDATSQQPGPDSDAGRNPGNTRASYLLVGLVAAGWLVFFWVILAIPVLGDATPPGSQVAALLLGILILLVLLLLGERPHWPAAARWWMFGCGSGLIGLAFLMNLGAPQFRGLLALGLMAIALPAGYWVGDRLEKLSNLIPVAVAFACADIFSVIQGPSKLVVDDLAKHQMLVEKARIDAAANLPPELAKQAADQAAAAIRAPLADYVVVHMPMPGTGSSVPVLGIGDFIIVALLFRAAWLYGLSPLAISIATLASIAVALTVSNLLGMAIPALPFIAVGVVGYLAVVNPKVRRLSRYELVLSVAIVLIFAALIAARWVYALI